MNAFKIFYSDVTNQGTRLDDYDGQEIQTLVAQQNGPTGPRDAQLLFAPGLASAPVESDRLVVVEINSNLYALGGASQGVEAALGLLAGERVLFSTDGQGNLQSVLRLRPDRTVEVLADDVTLDGNLQVDGTVSVGAGTDAVAMTPTVDSYFTIIDTTLSGLLTAVDSLTGGALKTAYDSAKSAAFGGTTIPSVASTNITGD